MRTCSVCLLLKEEHKFYKHKSIKPDGIRKQCTDCRNKKRRDTHKADPAVRKNQRKGWDTMNKDKLAEYQRKARKKDPERFKSYDLKSDFGITIVEYNDMFKKQRGLCLICDQPEKIKHQSGRPKALAVDHCHTTGKVRGLLCWVCNTGIGKLQDNPKLLRKAADYIEKAAV